MISVPLTFFGGIGGASKNGILIKGGNYMDSLAKVGTVVFDKTGTLTKGEFEVNAIHPDSVSVNRLLHLVAHVERFSTHPIAISLRNAYPNETDDCRVEISRDSRLWHQSKNKWGCRLCGQHKDDGCHWCYMASVSQGGEQSFMLPSTEFIRGILSSLTR